MGWTLTRAALCVVSLAVAGTQAATPPDRYFPPLPSAAATVWGQYLDLTEQRITGELASPKGFLALDFTPSAGAERQAVLDRKTPAAEVATLWPNGTKISVPDNWVHHWRGAILIPGVRLDQVFARLRKAVPGTGQGDVVKSSILSDDGTLLRTYIQVQRSGSVGPFSFHLVYNTEHDIVFTRLTSTRGKSTSAATKIAELYHPGTPQAREFAAGEDNGFLRRWNSYWRYEEIGAGVIAECEAVTLSRDAPSLASLFGARSFAESFARESLEHALVNLRAFFRTPPAPSPAR